MLTKDAICIIKEDTYPFDLLIVERHSWGNLDNTSFFQGHDLFFDSLTFELVGIWDFPLAFCFGLGQQLIHLKRPSFIHVRTRRRYSGLLLRPVLVHLLNLLVSHLLHGPKCSRCPDGRARVQVLRTWVKHFDMVTRFVRLLKVIHDLIQTLDRIGLEQGEVVEALREESAQMRVKRIDIIGLLLGEFDAH